MKVSEIFENNQYPDVVLASVRKNPYVIKYVPKPNPDTLSDPRDRPSEYNMKALRDPQFIANTGAYNEAVKRIFKDNVILMKKWLRYGEAMRGL